MANKSKFIKLQLCMHTNASLQLRCGDARHKATTVDRRAGGTHQLTIFTCVLYLNKNFFFF